MLRFINEEKYNVITMANLSELNTIIVEMFGVLSTLIGEVVNLITGDLLVLAVVAGFISLILGFIGLVYNMVKKHFNNATTMKK